MMKNILLAILSLVIILSLMLIIIFSVAAYNYLQPTEEEASPDWSPDGQRLTYECYIEGPTARIPEGNGVRFADEAADICIIGIDSANRVHLTSDVGAERYPVWSPTGLQIAFTRRDGIYIINGDGSNKRKVVQMPLGHDGIVDIGKVSWSPDGNQLLFSACLNENLKRDVYIVDVNTNTTTNLTEEHGGQAIRPRWTLEGTKIIFLSTSADLLTGTCVPVDSASYQITLINADRSDWRIVYDVKSTYPHISASNNGQIAFVTNLDIETIFDDSNDFSHLYILGLDGSNPTKINRTSGPVSWAPNGKWLAYDLDLKIFDRETNEIQELPSIGPAIYVDSIDTWSPDSQEFAVTTFEYPTRFHSEKHVYIIDVQHGVVRPLIPKRETLFN